MIYKLSLSFLLAFLINFTKIVLCEVQEDFTERKLSSILEKRAANETKNKNDDMKIDPSELFRFVKMINF